MSAIRILNKILIGAALPTCHLTSSSQGIVLLGLCAKIAPAEFA